MELWIGGYLAVGVLWVLWNSSSRLFQASAATLNEQGLSWALLLVAFVGVALWPVGLVGYLFWKLRSR